MLKGSLHRWGYAIWLLAIAAFAILHALNLQADFPNHSPWIEDWAKYTDEGWYGSAAVRAHLFGHWYVPGDFNPAPAVPLLPALEWLLFSVTGVRIEAARALAVGFFFLELWLAYLLLRLRGPRWTALLAVTLAVTSPFLYSFSRLAILEPLLMTLLLADLNLALRLPRYRRPVLVSAAIGLLFTLMLLTKTTAVFLLPALGWVMLAPLWSDKRKALPCALAAAATSALIFGGWMSLVLRAGLLADYKYLFFINKYDKPAEWYWPVESLWWALHGCLWPDRILLPLTAVVLLTAVLTCRTRWARRLWLDPAFTASALAVAGYILFMTYQYHFQPRYYVVVDLFACLLLATAVGSLLADGHSKVGSIAARKSDSSAVSPWHSARLQVLCGVVVLGIALVAAAFNGARTIGYAAHPQYTFVNAARDLARYIDQHPNGNPILVSVSADELSMITHVPSLCDDFGTVPLPDKLAKYRPGWWATWNDIDLGTLEDLHIHYSLEQVATFRALDHPERNLLVLFKLHPLPTPRPDTPDLQQPQPDDKIDIPVQ